MAMVMVMVVMLMLMLFIVMVMVVMAGAIGIVTFIFIVVVVMMVVMLMLFIVMVMVMMAGAIGIVALFILLVVMLMLDHPGKLFGQRILVLHGFQDLLAAELIPRGSDNHGILVVLTKQGNGCIQLILRNRAGAAEDDSGSGFHLIAVELAEIFQIHLALVGIGNGNKAAKGNVLRQNTLDGGNNIAEFPDTGGLDQNSVRMIIRDNLCQSLAEITDKRAADTAGIHLVDLNTGFLHKAAVNTDLAKLVFNQNDLLAGIGFLNHFFD